VQAHGRTLANASDERGATVALAEKSGFAHIWGMADLRPSVEHSPFELMGGEQVVRRVVEHFYECMSIDEPALAKLHQVDADGRVNKPTQERFGLFLIGWLGGPQDYTERHGHPRLRMRHGRVPVNIAMRDAWLRCMQKALDAEQITGELRKFLDQRFAEVADFLRNVDE
jgi:hemoglobin